MNWLSTTIDIFKLAIVAVSVIVQIRVCSVCLITLFPLACCYIFIFYNWRISLGSEERMDFLLGCVLLVFNERKSVRTLKVLDAFESYSTLLK